MATSQAHGALALLGEPERDDAMIRFFRAVHLNGLRQRGTDAKPLTGVATARAAGLSRPSVQTFSDRAGSRILRDKKLAIRSQAGYAIGVDIGHAHHTRVALSDIHGTMIQVLPPPEVEEGLLPRQSTRQALDAAEGQIRSIVEDFGVSQDKIVGVGISLPGPVVGHNLIGPSAGAWETVSPALELSRRLDWDIGKFVTGNDAYLSAVVERLWGGSSISDHAVYVKWSASLRAALIVDGQLYTGHSGTAGELPHIIVPEASDARCDWCGEQGCVHAIAELDAIARIAGNERLKASEVVAIALSDEKTMGALKAAAVGIGRAVAPYAAALNPEVVVLGGALGSRAFPYVLDDITAGLTGRFAAGNAVRVVGARLTERTATHGAIALALLTFAPTYLRDMVA